MARQRLPVALTVKPADGGQLITRADAGDAGVAHYTRKTNWRRDSTWEQSREGHDYWVPLPEEDDAQYANVAAFCQPFLPVTAKITLIHIVRRPNGEAVAIVGTPSTLYRFNLSRLGYFENPLTGLNGGDTDATTYAQGVEDSPYFEATTRWTVIGTGFSATSQARRWEAVDVNGTTVFNNGVDLPVAYRVEWSEVEPLYELREQGVVCVGSILVANGILQCLDITELRTTDIPRVLNALRSGAVVVTQTGYRESGTVSATTTNIDGERDLVTASGDFFVEADEGRLLMWWDGTTQRIGDYISATEVTVAKGTLVSAAQTFRVTDLLSDTTRPSYEITAASAWFTNAMVGLKLGWASGQCRRIVERVSGTVVRTDDNEPAGAGEAFVENPAAYLGREGLEAAFPGIQFDRRQWKVLCSELGDGRQFAAAYPITAAAESNRLVCERACRALQVGDAVAVVGAGASGGMLMTDTNNTPVTIVGMGPGFIELSLSAASDASGETATIQRSSSLGSVCGNYNLVDDGAGLLKGMVLQSRAVLFSDSNIWLGQYTGEPSQPWIWEKIDVPHGRSLHYRNTLVNVGGASLIYAGRNEFLQFDLTSRLPQPVASADLVANLFFDYATIDDTESIYASDNQLTKEIWMVCPANTTAPVLCYDYLKGTFATMDWAPTACPTLKEIAKPLVGATPDIFLMGTADGVVLQYGLATKAVGWWDELKAIWYRRQGRPYTARKTTITCTIKAGLNHFGNEFNQKQFMRYLVQASSLQPALPAPGLTVTFYSQENPNSTPFMEGAATVADLANHGFIPLSFPATYAYEEIVFTGQYPMKLHGRTWEGMGIRTGSYHKQS